MAAGKVQQQTGLPQLVHLTLLQESVSWYLQQHLYHNPVPISLDFWPIGPRPLAHSFSVSLVWIFV